MSNDLQVRLSPVTNRNTPLHRVDVGPITLYFSYETCVAFHVDGGVLTISENVWSSTTGRHLSELDGGDKAGRISYEEFERKLAEVVARIKVED